MIGGTKPRMPQKNAPLAAGQSRIGAAGSTRGRPGRRTWRWGPKAGAGETWWSLQTLKRTGAARSAGRPRNGCAMPSTSSSSPRLQEKGLQAERAGRPRHADPPRDLRPDGNCRRPWKRLMPLSTMPPPDAYDKLVDRCWPTHAMRALGPAVASTWSTTPMTGPARQGPNGAMGVAVPRLGHPGVRHGHAVSPILCRAKSPAMCCFRAIRTASSPRGSWSLGRWDFVGRSSCARGR